MKLYYKLLILLTSIGIIYGCQHELEDYLNTDTEETVNIELLNLLRENPNYSKYLSILERHSIDTVFAKGKSLTLFIPTNEAIEEMGELQLDTIDFIRYLFAESYINVFSIEGSRQIKTLGGKFATIESKHNTKFIDGIEIVKASPLSKNGRYYEIDGILQPLPNLYEYIALRNPFFQSYIDMQDSTFLDLFRSTPIGYNENGQTIYDSVTTVINQFAQKYFDIKNEFRTSRATMLLFDEDQFNNALSIIADDLSLESKDAIPDQWKNDILFPYLINQGVFWNELEYSDFASGRLRNILGDSVTVNPDNIDINSAFQCSNGKAFNYLNFVVPDSLYKGSQRIQGEHLIVSRGFGLYSWAENVSVTGPAVNPTAVRAANVADNDSLLAVNFPFSNYDQEFSLSFKFKNIFPGRYRLLWHGRTTPSGIFEILVNGEVQEINLGYGASDFIDLYDLRNPVRSVTNQVFRPDGGYNSFDILVENITEYGDVEVTIRYLGPGQRSNNGFILDYIELANF